MVQMHSREQAVVTLPTDRLKDAEGETPRKKIPSEQSCFVVSFPEGMKERIRASAKQNYRSINSEILARLQASFECFNLTNLLNAPESTWIRMMAKAITFDTATLDDKENNA